MVSYGYNWSKEFREKGPAVALYDRLDFHAGFNARMVMDNTGLCLATVRKHMRRLVKDGKATEVTPDRWRIVR